MPYANEESACRFQFKRPELLWSQRQPVAILMALALALALALACHLRVRGCNMNWRSHAAASARFRWTHGSHQPASAAVQTSSEKKSQRGRRPVALISKAGRGVLPFDALDMPALCGSRHWRQLWYLDSLRPGPANCQPLSFCRAQVGAYLSSARSQDVLIDSDKLSAEFQSPSHTRATTDAM